MTVVTLVPYAQALNADDIYPIRDNIQLDTPGTIGDGSLSDGSDETGVQIGAWADTSTVGTPFHGELTSVDFILPDPSQIPTALCFQMRAKTDPDVAADPPSATLDLFEWVMRAANYSSHTEYLDHQSVTDSDIPALHSLWRPDLSDGHTDTPTWFTFYSPAGTADPADPTSPGWIDLGPVDNENYGGLRQALATDGLRVTFGLFWNGEEPYTDRRAWWDVFEFRLLVAVEGGGSAPYVAPAYVRPSLRMTQRGGEGGMYGTPRFVGSPVRGLRQGPGSVY